jgi:hypothetical protein
MMSSKVEAEKRASEHHSKKRKGDWEECEGIES